MTRLLASLLLFASPALAQVVVTWSAETSSVLSTRAGDPAVVQPPAPGQEPLLVGTDTQGNGVSVWKLDGGLVQFLSTGQVTSADARGSYVAFASPSAPLWLFRHDGLGLTQVAPLVANSLRNLALTLGQDGGLEFWADTDSEVLFHGAFDFSDGGTSFAQVGATKSMAQAVAGLAADDRTGRVYVGQPTLGIIRVERDGTQAFLVSIDAGTLGSVVGGLDLYLAADGGAWLFSCAPAEDAVAVHVISGTTAQFKGLLSVGEPDGGATRVRLPSFVDVAVTPGASTPRGSLVISDGVIGNYKVVDLAALHARFPLPTPFGALPVVVDAGTPDAGAADAGGGTGGGGGAGAGGGSGRPPGPLPGSDPPPTGCGCTASSLPLLPALLLLWWIRRPRS
jgi:myo-inositol-hexaphosphate 3-phosphohydrolase